jgi:hypothetical protein
MLAARPEDQAACPTSLAYEKLPPGAEANLFLPGLPRTCKSWVVCVSSPQGTDFALRALHGQLHLGRYHEGAPCEGEVVGDGQEVWHRLDAGTHALCVAEMPEQGARPHPFEGWWLVAKGEAAVSLREEADHFVDRDAPPRRRRALEDR